jgi:Fe-S-cluster containining protein
MTSANEDRQPVSEQAEEPDCDVEDFDDGDDVEAGTETHSDCRCAECCRNLIIEVGLDDAKREPKIAELCEPIYHGAELTGTGKRELAGYMLNKVDGDGYACRFLDDKTNDCTIYETRHWACRVFDCDGEQRDELVQLGILPPKGERRR